MFEDDGDPQLLEPREELVLVVAPQQPVSATVAQVLCDHTAGTVQARLIRVLGILVEPQKRHQYEFSHIYQVSSRWH